jgi:hypothetical protein
MNAIVTYIYPNAIKYLETFLNDLKLQSINKFDLIIFNDQVKNLYLPENNIKTSVYPLNGTPLEIRFHSFEILKKLNYENYIFLDIDDLMSDKRVEIVVNKLEKNSIVCNDLNLMDDNGNILVQNVWKNRLENDFTFDYNFIKDKNIVGFGNVALKRNLLFNNIKLSNYPLVGDWFIFYQLLKKSNSICTFTSECQTNYRQHEQNQVGLQKSSKEKWTKALNVAKLHYEGLKEIGCEDHIPIFSREYSKLNEINNYPFWWEEIKIIDEKN